MEQGVIVIKIKEQYLKLFGEVPVIVRSPGRVNIIGEHTDYNEGYVLPAAIDKAIFIAIGKRDDDLIKLHSSEFGEDYQVRLPDLKKSETHWANYILGVAAQFIKNGHYISGFNLVVDGNVPIGAGLSSSAAVECSVAFGLNKIFALNIQKIDLVKMSQKAEHEYAGVMCGIMDQFASTFGKKDHVIKLDCRSLEYEYVPFKLQGYKIVLLNTNVSHSLASSEYNTRRQQCEQGVAWLKEKYADVKSLRDATMHMLNDVLPSKDEIIYRRCKYVVEENERLLAGCTHLEEGDIKRLGDKMFRTHEGLSKEYEVSCPELDFLVEEVKASLSVMGARMMGGGFGGCTINIVKEKAVEKLISDVAEKYKTEMGKELTAYTAVIEDGSSEVVA